MSYVGPFQGLGGGAAAIRRSNQATFPALTKLLVACIGQEMHDQARNQKRSLNK
jgi:hypothetical protein